MRNYAKLSNKERQQLADFTSQLEGRYTLEQYMAAGKFWNRLSADWNSSGIKASGQLRLICWYNTSYKPGAKESRPKAIIEAALEVCQPKRAGQLINKLPTLRLN